MPKEWGIRGHKRARAIRGQASYAQGMRPERVSLPERVSFLMPQEWLPMRPERVQMLGASGIL